MDIKTIAQNILFSKGIGTEYLKYVDLSSEETVKKSITRVEKNIKQGNERRNSVIKAIREESRIKHL